MLRRSPFLGALAALILCVLTLVVAATSASAQEFDWTEPVNASNSATVTYSPVVAVDRKGTTHLVWSESVLIQNRPCCPTEVWRNTITYWESVGGGFSTPVALTTYEHRFSPTNISIVFDADDNPLVFWAAQEVTYVKRVAGGWTAPTYLTFLPFFRGFGSQFERRYAEAVSDRQGRIFVVAGEVFVSGISRLVFTTWDGSTWTAPSVLNFDVTNLTGGFDITSGSPDLAVDSQGRLHMVWDNRTPASQSQILYSTYDGHSWSDPQLVFQFGAFQGPPKIALDSSDRPHVVWDSYLDSCCMAAVYSTLQEGAWSPAKRLSNGSPGNHSPVIQLDSANTVHVLFIERYSNQPLGIQHVQKRQGVWSEPRQVGPDGNGPNSLFYDGERNVLHFAWQMNLAGERPDIYYSRTAPPDMTPPLSSVLLEGDQGNDGWYTGDVTLTLSASDTGTGVRGMKYSLGGGDLISVDGASVTIPISSEGETNLNFQAVDNEGNVEEIRTTIIKIDKTAPVLNLPQETLVAEATDADGAVITYTESATDNLGGPVITDCTPMSGTVFQLGATTITCNATDGAGNTSAGSFQVNVRDTTAPALDVPDDVSAEATGAPGANINFQPATATDAVGVVSLTCTHTPGNTFPLGATTVTCTAKDAANNKSSASFVVTVVDTTPPAISGTPTAIVTEATSAAGAAVTYTNPTATDLVSGAVAVNCAPSTGSTFAIGLTAVMCAATDARGNTSTSSFTVTVLTTDLLITKTASQDPVTTRSNLTYTITVTNNGPGVARGIILSDTMPAGTSFVSATTSLGTTCTPDGAGVLMCGLGDLINGASASLSLTVFVSAAPNTNISNTASAVANTYDPNGADNTIIRVTQVIAGRPINPGPPPRPPGRP